VALCVLPKYNSVLKISILAGYTITTVEQRNRRRIATESNQTKRRTHRQNKKSNLINKVDRGLHIIIKTRNLYIYVTMHPLSLSRTHQY